MQSFPFTEKRLCAMPTARRHKWITIWLRTIYTDILGKRCDDRSLKRFFEKYLKIQSWLGQPVDTIVRPTSYLKWIEFVSDQFHEHRKLSGKGLAEADFLPKVATGDRSRGGRWTPGVPYRVALDNMRSAFNVGSIIRVIDAVRFESILLSGNAPGKEHAQVLKTAMGCADWIPQKRYKVLQYALKRAKNRGYAVIGIETIPESGSYLQFSWPEKGIVVLGNEEFGISEEVLKVCDDFVHLPMYGYKNSINVANAFAVIAFHISSIRRVSA
jgi:23S rRNA (guanosine2251-2'-O)-methyltransferase